MASRVRFHAECSSTGTVVSIHDALYDRSFEVHEEMLENIQYFDLPNYYAVYLRMKFVHKSFRLEDLNGELLELFYSPWNLRAKPVQPRPQENPLWTVRNRSRLELNVISTLIEATSSPALQGNAATPREVKRLIPEPAVVVVHINGHPARALLASGSLSDFMSSKLAPQLGASIFEFEKPLLLESERGRGKEVD